MEQEATIQGIPSQKEIDNAQKVLGYLSEIDGISFDVARSDIFIVKNVEVGMHCMVDVEEDVVAIRTDVCEVPQDAEQSNALCKLLLELNNQALHGAFAIAGTKVIYKDNLEFENLDCNELEASISWALCVVGNGIEKIAETIGETLEEADEQAA